MNMGERWYAGYSGCMNDLTYGFGTVRLGTLNLEPTLYYCPYCHGNSTNDSRGRCSCCGAPRDDDTRSWRAEFSSIVENSSGLLSRETILNEYLK